MDPKPQSRSRTLWANYLALAVAILALPQLGAVLPPEVLPILATVMPILNILLRQMTGQPLAPMDLAGVFRRR